MSPDERRLFDDFVDELRRTGLSPERVHVPGISSRTVRRYMGGGVPTRLEPDTKLAMSRFLSRRGREGYAAQGNDGGQAQRVRDALAGAPQPDADKPPSFEQMEWIPRLLERIISIPDISPMEKVRMMAEVNAAGMRYWAVSAEWAAGQRGMAMQEAERAGGERARATRTEAASARDRARTLDRGAAGAQVQTMPLVPMDREVGKTEKGKAS